VVSAFDGYLFTINLRHEKTKSGGHFSAPQVSNFFQANNP